MRILIRIRGYAGEGKTTTLKQLQTYLEQTGWDCTLVLPNYISDPPEELLIGDKEKEPQQTTDKEPSK